MKSVELSSGDLMPLLGLGTWELKGEDCVKGVRTALDLGYRHIDAAKIYGNHKQVARGIKDSDVDREDLFLTTKVWNDSHEYDDVIASGEQFLKELAVDYIDLLLIHWPVEEVPVAETLEAMQELKERGLVRNIGVSNFMKEHLHEVFAESSIEVVNNQIKFHPYHFPEELMNFCQEQDISVTAYSPLARGDIFDDEVLTQLSDKYDHSVVQLTLKWIIDQEVIAIPKATSKEHIKENMDIFDWELPEEVKKVLDTREQNYEE